MTSAVATQFLPVVAAASATKDYLIVSVHDVAPSTKPIADKIISELTAKGIRHCSLLVVPDYHHQGASMQDRQFVSWLRNLEAAGNEIVIHGYFHERPRQARQSSLDRLSILSVISTAAGHRRRTRIGSLSSGADAASRYI